MLRNLALFFVLLFSPGVIIAFITQMKLINSTVFVILAGAYFFLYIPILCGIRLVSIGRIKPGQIFLLLVPGVNLLFFKDLYMRNFKKRPDAQDH